MCRVVRKASWTVVLGAVGWISLMLMVFSVWPVGAQDLDPLDSALSGAVTSPDALPITVGGPWSGTITDDMLGAGTFMITFNKPSNRNLSGGWNATFSNQPELLGNFKGTATAKRVNFNLNSGGFDSHSCRLKFKSSSAGGGFIQGNYKWVNCGKQFKGDKGGSISITPVVP